MPVAGQIVGIVIISLAFVATYTLRIWTRHQERMSEIAHRSGVQERESEISRLRGEVSEMKELLHEQIIAMDSMHREHNLKERLEQKN